MNARHICLFLVFWIYLPLFVVAQQNPISVVDASNPATIRSRANLDFESYFFFGGATYYVIRPAFFYGLQNQKHQVGMSLPFMHNIFTGDYGGFENTTGIGDLKMIYMGVPVIKKEAIGLQRVSTYLEVTAPTGESLLGRGAGVWAYKPGVILTYRSAPNVTFYPEFRFQFSANPANSQGGGDGLPDPDDPQTDRRLRNFSVLLPAVVEVIDWDGWFSLNLIYIRSMEEDTDFLFLRTDIGKMMSPTTAGSLRITKFVAGQPRLNVQVQASFQFFIR